MGWSNPFSEENRGRAGNAYGGAALGNIVAGPAGMAYGAVKGGTTRGGWDPFGTTKSHSQAKQGERLAAEQYKKSQPYYDQMDQADDAYRTAAQPHFAEMRSRISNLDTEASSQAGDARATYKNTIQPRLKNIMEEAGREASGAMTLQQAGDPNNAVHKAVRGMYDQQAKGVQRQGLQDFGVLSALGAQAAQGAMGAPMTAGQQANIYAANQGQAGNAYSAAQRRMFDLQQQGLDRGFSESAAQYERGQGAKDRYRQSLGDISGAEADYMDRQRGFRQERLGYGGADMELGQQRAGLDRDLAYGKSERRLGSLGNYYGQKNQVLENRMGDNAARQQGQYGILSSIIGAGGRAAGAA